MSRASANDGGFGRSLVFDRCTAPTPAVVRRVALTIDTGKKTSAARNPFLNGKRRVVGVLEELCPIGSPRFACGKLTTIGVGPPVSATELTILPTSLFSVDRPDQFRRVFTWEFVVIGSGNDGQHLFTSDFDVDDLFASLTGSEPLATVRFTSEGGFEVIAGVV